MAFIQSTANAHTRRSLLDHIRYIDAVNIIQTSIQLWEAWKRRRWVRKELQIDRNAFKNYLRLDDSLLADVGVTRSEILSLSQLPLSINAALELERIRQRKREIH